MNSRNIAFGAALAAAAAWTAKGIAIGVAGGLDKSPFEAPLFFAGLLLLVVALVALGVAVTPGARTGVRVAAGLGTFVVGLAFTLTIDGLVGAFHAPGVERHWVWTEFNLWVAAVVVVGVTLAAHRTRLPRRTPA